MYRLLQSGTERQAFRLTFCSCLSSCYGQKLTLYYNSKTAVISGVFVGGASEENAVAAGNGVFSCFCTVGKLYTHPPPHGLLTSEAHNVTELKNSQRYQKKGPRSSLSSSSSSSTYPRSWRASRYEGEAVDGDSRRLTAQRQFRSFPTEKATHTSNVLLLNEVQT